MNNQQTGQHLKSTPESTSTITTRQFNHILSFYTIQHNLSILYSSPPSITSYQIQLTNSLFQHYRTESCISTCPQHDAPITQHSIMLRHAPFAQSDRVQDTRPLIPSSDTRGEHTCHLEKTKLKHYKSLQSDVATWVLYRELDAWSECSCHSHNPISDCNESNNPNPTNIHQQTN